MRAKILASAIVSAGLLLGCAARRPAERFNDYHPLSEIPRTLSETGTKTARMKAKISLRAPGLRGTASGIIRHARDGQYLVELYGRGELFLRVYFTESQTVLWPAVGMPEFFAVDDTPTLSQSLHVLLPSWRLDDVLPVALTSRDEGTSLWSSEKEDVLQVVERSGHEPLWKSFRRPSGDSEFPYRKVAIYSESGRSRLTWTLDTDPVTAHKE